MNVSLKFNGFLEIQWFSNDKKFRQSLVLFHKLPCTVTAACIILPMSSVQKDSLIFEMTGLMKILILYSSFFAQHWDNIGQNISFFQM